jgi:hypothetical protein
MDRRLRELHILPDGVVEDQSANRSRSRWTIARDRLGWRSTRHGTMPRGPRRVAPGLYQRPELAGTGVVCVVEGEKAVDALRRLGLVAERHRQTE